jgi:putative glutamine amidotransferase
LKPIIGIAGNERTMTMGETFWLSYTSRNFVEGIQDAGGLPLVLPIGQPEDAKRYIQRIDKLLLGGGHDVNPKLYGQEPHPYLEEINEKRDAFELKLIDEAIKQGKPIFGICRGMQLINVAFGGSLYQDISLFGPTSIKHVQESEMTKQTHLVQIKASSRLATFLPEDYSVNSYHHQTIKNVAPNFTVIAQAPDGIIEGIEANDLPILAIQWHPELTRNALATEQQLFTYFVKEL